MKVHPNSKALITLTGDAAVVRAVKNLIMTNHYERPFHPEIGSNLRAMLFENILPSTALNIKNIIVEAIENFETRIRLNAVVVKAAPEDNRYDVTMEYYIINDPVVKTSSFFLERIR
jgi:phage baseplate assembly protein W